MLIIIKDITEDYVNKRILHQLSSTKKKNSFFPLVLSTIDCYSQAMLFTVVPQYSWVPTFFLISTLLCTNYPKNIKMGMPKSFLKGKRHHNIS